MASSGIPPLPPPHTRVGVGGVLIRNGRVLVNRAVYRTRFTIPSGYVDPGEGLATALAREFVEETGVTVEVGPLLLARHKVIAATESDVFFAFLVHHRVGTPSARPPEIAEFREVPLEEAPRAEWIAQLSREAIAGAARPGGAWPRAGTRTWEVPGLSNELFEPPEARGGGPDPRLRSQGEPLEPTG